MRRRLLTLLACGLAMGGLAWWALSPGPSATAEVPGPAEVSEAPVAVPVVRRVEEEPPDDGARPTSRMDMRRAAYERRKAEAWVRLDDMVQSGEITEEEAQQLRAITLRTLRRVEHLMDRREDGEISGIGLVVRSIPTRITHLTQVVDSLGRDRAREIGAIWREREVADRAQRRSEAGRTQ